MSRPNSTQNHTVPAHTARHVALDTLMRIDTGGAFANLALSQALARSDLAARDRGLVTELVYGTTRMRRACDWLVDRYLVQAVQHDVRNVLRLGAYQLAFMHTPAHAAVSETVSLAPRRARGLVNAVLRRVADNPVPDVIDPLHGGWPSLAVQLSYPDWIVDRLVQERGEAAAIAALRAMNEPAQVHTRPDGYIQDLASQAVVAQLGVTPGMAIVDVCAAPGGKATGIAALGATVVAADRAPKRVGLIAQNVERLGLHDRVFPIVADGRALPLASGQWDGVLVDAPCSGLGSLRRRADARWRITSDDVARLSQVQTELVTAAAALVKKGGRLVYSVCTMLDAETVDVDAQLRSHLSNLTPVTPTEPFVAHGAGGMLMPSHQGSDGMACFVYTVD